MIRQVLFFCAWVIFILYAWLGAPAGDEGYLRQLVLMNDPEPLLLTVFSLLGIYPIAFGIFLLRHDHARVPAWPFVAGSFMLGAFALMPYFFSSTSAVRSVRTPKGILKFIQKDFLLLSLVGISIFLIVQGFWQGSLEIYLQAFFTSRFVHVMTIDFFVLSLLSIYVIRWDEKKRDRGGTMAWFGVLPVIGLLIYCAISTREKGE
ncbi:hypothetical protein LCL89_15265 [Halobacillus yeomjeoni]|uniref:hypothetical protein n=1 Tax=Halobacillus yeomjeoni TaxID=311194 RepID=UPI001CD481B0|nr:hypothetical protein [Halobacillus yeomjeoni]MCA0985393.1 hypothetical protein [Halobacillus yeomjeoni]